MARRFGIEIEFKNDDNGRLFDLYSIASVMDPVVGQFSNHKPIRVIGDNDDDDDEFCRDDDYYRSGADEWTVKYDGSCEFEVTTPASTWRDWPQIRAVLRALYTQGARTDRSCGLHVHHEAKHLDDTGLRKLWYLWYLHEPLIFSMLAPSRVRNSYCERYRQWPRQHNIEPLDLLGMDSSDFQFTIDDIGRYQSLNLTHWWQHGRVEIRAHHGTLKSTDIRFWTKFTQMFLKLPNRVSLETLKTMSPNLEIPEQLSQLTRLIVPNSQVSEYESQLLKLIERRNPQILQPA